MDFFLPVDRQLRQVRQDLAALQEVVGQMAQSVERATGEASVYPRLLAQPRRLALYALWLVATCSTLDALFWVLPNPADGVVLGLAENFWWLMGFWLGVRVPGRHLGAYVAIGLLFGPIQWMSIELVDHILKHPAATSGIEWLGLLLGAGVAGAIVYALTGTLGDFVERVLARQKGGTGLLATLQRRLDGIRRQYHGKRSLERVGQLVAAFGPVITLIGTLMAAKITPSTAEKQQAKEDPATGTLFPGVQSAGGTNRTTENFEKTLLSKGRSEPGTVKSGTRVRITSISETDAYYEDRERLIEKEGYAPEGLEGNPDGWYYGAVVLDRPLRGQRRLFFAAVKVDSV